MIHHISIAVENPQRVARVLAEILEGNAYEFLPHPGSYIAVPYDNYGTAIEIYPAGTEILPGPDNEQQLFVQNPGQTRFGAVHAAISVSSSLNKIEQIGAREGWRTLLCNRGPFHVIEFWVENWLMLEFLSPEIVPQYLEFNQRHNVEAFFGKPVCCSELVKAQTLN